ncbi:hypothetical protein ANN_23083 [Periplaneta americana]|uniref:Protein sleepless n=1 Tax=Periplaneta americana TaxID=6978 RepID=A0ABQ8SL45_PERAM|nr:hypothetical protein ANN_23083 [Periplaneta americana]
MEARLAGERNLNLTCYQCTKYKNEECGSESLLPCPPNKDRCVTHISKDAREGPRPTSRLLASRPHAEAEVDDHPTRMEVSRYSWYSQPDFPTYLRPVYVIDVYKLTPSNGPKERSRRARDLTVASDNLSAIEFRPAQNGFTLKRECGLGPCGFEDTNVKKGLGMDVCDRSKDEYFCVFCCTESGCNKAGVATIWPSIRLLTAMVMLIGGATRAFQCLTTHLM